MSLDFTKLVPQVGSMVSRFVASREEMKARLKSALDIYYRQNLDVDRLKSKITKGKITWLVAGLDDELRQIHTLPRIPENFMIISTDGSHIDIDRHRSTKCYLLNIGSVKIHYGKSPNASFETIPKLYDAPEDQVIVSENNRQQFIEGTLLGIKRSIEECSQLTRLAHDASSEDTVLALLDGTLILWNLEAFPEFVIKSLLVEGFLHQLNELRKLSNAKHLGVASYISFPRSTDVVNLLRIIICPYEPVNCDKCPEQPCSEVAGLTDRELFSAILNPGERSPLFYSQSSIINKYYGVHQIYFFYLRLAGEIARVEIPKWIASDSERLNIVHSLVVNQCQRGHGYPVALSEAHELAVVSTKDRDNFWQLIESSLTKESLPSVNSAKSISKRTRWI